MNTGNILDDISGTHLTKNRRRKLLPWWIKICIWIFIVSGVLTIPIFIMGTVGYSFNMQIYGIESSKPISISGFCLLFIFILKAVTSISMWFETDWAIKLALVDTYLGLAICSGVVILSIITDQMQLTFRPEIIILIPYLMKLNSIKKIW